MALNAREKAILKNIVDLLEGMAFSAADPHLDCRDEMQTSSAAISELWDELDEPDDQVEADKPADIFEAEEKRGGA